MRWYTGDVPTVKPRIQVPFDGDLAAAVAEVGGGKSKAQAVHDLALRGAEALRDEHEGRQEAIAHLVRIANGEDDGYDFAVSAQLHAER